MTTLMSSSSNELKSDKVIILVSGTVFFPEVRLTIQNSVNLRLDIVAWTVDVSIYQSTHVFIIPLKVLLLNKLPVVFIRNGQ